MENTVDKINNIASKEVSPWLEDAKKREQNIAWTRRSFKIACSHTQGDQGSKTHKRNDTEEAGRSDGRDTTVYKQSGKRERKSYPGNHF